jgi:antitoxin ParD1/3/4
MIMKTTSVALGPHFEEFIQASILSGRYNNASEVVRSGLRLLEDQEQKMTALRAAIEEGLASGYVEDFDSKNFLQEMKARKHGKV